MKVYIAEVRPKTNKTPFFWKLVLDVIGTGYYHTGMVIDNKYCELSTDNFKNNYDIQDFVSFEESNEKRISNRGNSKEDGGDSMDFFEVPYNFSQIQINTMVAWWKDKQDRHVRYGMIRFVSLLFWRFFFKISKAFYYKTGRVLIFSKTAAERSIRVCSTAVDECLKCVDVDLFVDRDETHTLPGMFAEALKDTQAYRG